MGHKGGLNAGWVVDDALVLEVWLRVLRLSTRVLPGSGADGLRKCFASRVVGNFARAHAGIDCVAHERMHSASNPPGNGFRRCLVGEHHVQCYVPAGLMPNDSHNSHLRNCSGILKIEVQVLTRLSNTAHICTEWAIICSLGEGPLISIPEWELPMAVSSVVLKKKGRKTSGDQRDPLLLSPVRKGTSSAAPISPSPERPAAFDPRLLLTKLATGKTTRREYQAEELVFSQGDTADAVFYIQSGKVKLTVVSKRGKEAVIAILPETSFFGEGCLAGQPFRMSTANTVQRSTIIRVEKPVMLDLLHREPEFAERFLGYLLSRNIRMEADLVDHLFNSSEKRLARLLLLLANFGQESKPIPVVAKISQETLAEMIGTTRSRVSFFMNRFRDLGFIDYNGGGMHVHSSLVSVVLHD